MDLKKDILHFIKEYKYDTVAWETIVDKFQGRWIKYLKDTLQELWDEGEIYCPKFRKYKVV